VGSDLVAEDGERHGAAAEDGVVEGLEVEARAELPLRVGAQAADLELAEFVAEGLRGPVLMKNSPGLEPSGKGGR
jgi:hypothetical protein